MDNLRNIDGSLTVSALEQGYTQNNGKGLQLVLEHSQYAVINNSNWKWFKTYLAAQKHYSKLNK
jgi:hypothetical protein